MFSKRTIVANEYNANTNCTKSIYSRLRQIRRLVLVSVFFRRSMDIQFLFGQKNTKGKNSRNKSILYTHICNFIPTVQGISSHCEKKMLNFFLMKFCVVAGFTWQLTQMLARSEWWTGESNITYEYWMWSHTWKWEFIETTSCVRSFILQWLRLAHHYIVVSRLFFVLSFVHSDSRILLLNRVCDHWWSFLAAAAAATLAAVSSVVVDI